MSGTVPDRFVSENASIRKQPCQESPAGGMMSVFADSQRSGHHLPDTFLDGFPLNYPASFLAECQVNGSASGLTFLSSMNLITDHGL
jgi:hypothetical protein